MAERKEQEIKDILGKLRASVDNPQGEDASAPMSKNKADSADFDRTIAQMIEKHLSSREEGEVGDTESEVDVGELEIVKSGEVDVSAYEVSTEGFLDESLIDEPNVEAEIPEETPEEIYEEISEEEKTEQEVSEQDSSESVEIPAAYMEVLQDAFAADGDLFESDSADGEPVENIEEEVEEEIEPEEEEDDFAPLPIAVFESTGEPTEQEFDEEFKEEQEIEQQSSEEEEDDFEPLPIEDFESTGEPTEQDFDEEFEEEQEIEQQSSEEEDDGFEPLPIVDFESSDEPTEQEFDEEFEEFDEEFEEEQEVGQQSSEEEEYDFEPLPIEDFETSDEPTEQEFDEEFEEEIIEETVDEQIVAAEEQEPAAEDAPEDEPEDELEEKLASEEGSAIAAAISSDNTLTYAESSAREAAGEYISHEADTDIRSRYYRRRAATILRLIGTALLCFIAAFMENVHLFGYRMMDPFDRTGFPHIYFLTLTAVLLLATALSARRFAEGIRSIFTFEPTPHSLSAVAVTVSFIFNIVMYAIKAPVLSLLNFPAILTLVMSVANELIRLCREMTAFEVVSSENVRYCTHRLSRKFELENSAESEESGKQDYRRHYRVASTDFTDGYFARTQKSGQGIYLLNFLVLPSLAAGIIAAVIGVSAGDGGYEIAASFAAAVIGCLPTPLLIALSLPAYISVKRLSRKKCTVVGDDAVREYSEPLTLMFDDRIAFPSNRIGTKGLKVYDGVDVYDVLIKTGSLFAAIGGPLGKVFEAENAKYHRIKDVKVLRVEEEGVEAILGGSVKLQVGSRSFIESLGIIPERISKDDRLAAGGEISVIYVVADGRPAARLYCDYRPSEIFEDAAERLLLLGNSVCICSADPAIVPALLRAKCRASVSPLSVVKKFSKSDEEPEFSSVDSGIVAIGRPERIVDAIEACHEIKKKRKLSLIIYTAAFVLNIVGISVLSVLGFMSYAGSAVLACYMLLWTAPAIILAFSENKKGKKKSEQK